MDFFTQNEELNAQKYLPTFQTDLKLKVGYVQGGGDQK